MKNTVITARRKKTELLTLLACFIIGNLANLYAIISYETPFSEMLTSFFYVLAFSGVALCLLDNPAHSVLWDKKFVFEEKKCGLKMIKTQ